MGKRMYYILRVILKAQPYITRNEIKEELKKYQMNENVKTISEDVKRINAFFEDIVEGELICSKKNAGFYVNKDFFDDGELQFLFDSVTYHKDLKDEDKDKIKNKLTRWTSQMQKKRLVQSEVTKQDLSFSLFVNLSTLMKAIAHKKVVRFEYIHYTLNQNHLVETSSLQPYFVSPYHMIVSNNHYYLIGYNRKYEGRLSMYRIDRMRVIQTSKEPFVEIREQYDMQDEIDKMMNMYVSLRRDDLTLQCHQHVLREVVSQFSKDVKVEKGLQEYVEVKIEDVSISEGLIGWIMMMQDCVKVLSPNYLKEDIKERLSKMRDLYQ